MTGDFRPSVTLDDLTEPILALEDALVRRHILLFIFSLLVLGFTHLAQMAQAADLTPVKPIVPCFYSLTKDGHVSYILGTIHNEVGIEELPIEVLNILNSSQQVAGEMAFSRQEVREQLTPGFLLSRLKFALSERAQRRSGNLPHHFAQLLMAHGVPAELVKNMRTEDEYCNFAKNPKAYFGPVIKMLDLEILNYAYSQNKKIYALETDDSRDKALLAMGESRCTIHKITTWTDEEFRAQTVDNEQVLRDYRNGELNTKNMLRSSSYRHNSWVPKMIELHNTAKTFFFVGTNHLISQENLLVELMKNGFEVEKMSFK